MAWLSAQRLILVSSDIGLWASVVSTYIAPSHEFESFVVHTHRVCLIDLLVWVVTRRLSDICLNLLVVAGDLLSTFSGC